MTDAEIIDEIIAREGGFVDHPSDRGGATKFGITAATLSAYRDAAVSEADVEAMSIDEARAIYRRDYLVRPGIDKIVDDHLRALVLDFAVNSGPAQAIRCLQRVLGVQIDGALGPVTLLALPHLDQFKVAMRFMAARIRFQGRLVTDHPAQAVFAAGWAARSAEMLEWLVL